MKHKIELVKLTDIGPDETFRISTERSISDLIVSIKEEGLITPPLLVFKDDQYVVVSGFRRVDACRKAGIPGIYARVLNHLDDFTLQKYAILENSSQRELNIVEQSLSVSKLAPFLKEPKERTKTISMVVRIARNPSLIEKLLKISNLPRVIRSFMVEDYISLAIALELAKLEDELAIKFGTIFKTLKMSLNIQKEVLTNTIESSLREKISPYDILDSKDFKSILHDEEKNRNEKTSLIRKYLKERRYPNISKAELYYQKKVKELNLTRTKLIPPGNFEGTNYGISLKFSTIDELEKCADELGSLSRNPAMEDILKREY
jgi:ParB/RepB/Spo0J family partition protein